MERQDVLYERFLPRQGEAIAGEWDDWQGTNDGGRSIHRWSKISLGWLFVMYGGRGVHVDRGRVLVDRLSRDSWCCCLVKACW